ncbi:MAG: RNA methyltransferase [Chitinophagaceae bacterium]|nr:RNA methyltransferase [Chitinophagaceae bacterium]
MLMKSKIKYIQSLSQKKLREQEGVFVAEGPKIVGEILQAPNTELEQIFATRKWILQNPLQAQDFEEKLMEVNDDELKRISFLQSPNMVLGIFKQPVFVPFNVTDKVSLMLDAIQDPGNLGTIVRCADWFGVQQIICSRDCADIFSSKVVQSTMGSICRVQVIYEDLLSFIQSHSNVLLYAATLKGVDLSKYPNIQEGIILIGNESKGIQPELLSMVDHQITIPGKGNAESLNAAIATGIILSHLI